ATMQQPEQSRGSRRCGVWTEPTATPDSLRLMTKSEGCGAQNCAGRRTIGPMSSECPPAGAGEASAAVGRRPRYRTWIRSTRLAVFAALSGACLAGSALSLLSLWFLLFLVPFALFGYIAMILALTVYRFAPRGGDLQRRIHDLIVAKAELPAA